MSSNRTCVTVALKAMPSYSASIAMYGCAADGSVRLPHSRAGGDTDALAGSP
ncbi:hypothetical protein PC114_g2035 [Phytophthora cactorum]|nr:hypothetical protein PC114_g2035 [Phytophthora cactorum]